MVPGPHREGFPRQFPKARTQVQRSNANWASHMEPQARHGDLAPPGWPLKVIGAIEHIHFTNGQCRRSSDTESSCG